MLFRSIATQGGLEGYAPPMNNSAKHRKKKEQRFSLLFLFAVRKGLEPSTSGVTGRHSNQLNYRTRLVAS